MQIQTTTCVPAVLEFNFEEVKNNLQEHLEKYQDLVVTEENQKEMKSTLADLNKTAKSIDDYRKEQKKLMSEPIKKFEDKCKELSELVVKVSSPIKVQLDVFEETRMKGKEEEIKLLIQNVVDNVELNPYYANQLDILPKYLNKTAKEKDIVADLEARAAQLKLQQDAQAMKEKIQAQKTDLIQKEIEEANNKYKINLKISSFQYLMSDEYEMSDISSVIEKEARSNFERKEYYKKLEEKEEQAEAEVTQNISEKKEEVKKAVKNYNFTLQIENCSLEAAKELKEFLEERGIQHKMIQE
ncbi:hypothetical protein FSBG_00148 [Fusobacterium gonidiaformans 3-1-5R]|uniref:DUF1351 domain-containing protein n=1 Tax=Fusobacterium gonidiaformans 3-1-5R TaxID=469605 RepID=E5BEX0_9FUSO|nr:MULTISPECIES: DUF1351 domain-containing protein [Fusobacterium]EFS20651.1 hypothetical protein FSBG_00148 [Fusobacterium gonidiaformans 3-1-5R]KYM58538.1 hypothetical protein A2U09_07730 [Fusobacterium necrophorum subsp. funduliforme]